MRSHIRLISATETPKVSCVFELDMTPRWSNRMGNMHGGAVALVFDMCTTMCAAPLAREGFWVFGGVSRNLSVTCFGPVRMGGRLRCIARCCRWGGGWIRFGGEMREKETGVVLCVCEHNKASLEFEGGGGSLL